MSVTEARGPAAHAGASAGAPARASARALLRDTARRDAPHLVALLLTDAAAAGAALALPAVVARALDLVLAGRAAAGWIAVCAALVAAATALDALSRRLQLGAEARGAAHVRRTALAHMLGAGPRLTARVPPGDLVTRTVGNGSDAGLAPAAAATSLASLALPAGGFVALLLIDVRLAAVLLVGGPALLLVLRALARRSSDCAARYQRAQGDLAERLVETLEGARTVAAAGTAARERDRVLEPLPELSLHGRAMWRVHGRAAGQAAAVVPLLQVLVLAAGGLLLASGALTVGALLAASRYAALASGVGALTGTVAVLARARAAAARVAAVLDVPAPGHGAGRLPPGDGTLSLRGVTVSHGGRVVLRDVDLTVPGGSTVAVVGRSGAGKSLLAAVAGRLVLPDEGEVLLDGTSLAVLSRVELRAAVSYAFARPELLGDTLGDAVDLGVRTPTPGQREEAARAAHADGFVALLPDGWSTAVGDAPLSGGERQRLGLTRAFAHAGRVLILDDATSSLDTATELRVQRALLTHSAVHPGTRLLVAHRATTAARADLVAWLDGGHVRALAPHTALWPEPEYRAVFTESLDADA
ncbi:ATP-binding cassette domain-containing protein [Streptomyces sp. NPDC048172]|uniref:ATP-binding cassette domain-containing protein n=1 Tax=Streptomyces sp. NPDC048172 TaxID=3365505 RepID=UPI003711DE3F